MFVAALFLLLALAAVCYTAAAAVIVGRMKVPPAPSIQSEPVTLLKPLYGAEPRLAENLATFLDQDWDAPIELVAGVQRADDPAREAIALLHSPAKAEVHLPDWTPAFAGERCAVEVLDPTPHGANPKIANLINMAPAATHDLIVLSDSDMVVPRDYLRHVAAALDAPNVGVVTCLYRGRGDTGAWSALCAGSISYFFLPAVLFGRALGLARPCMGSTIALRRETLARIGGFEAFADILADDYAVGEAVRALGLEIAIPPIVLTHAFTEASFAQVWRHEMRWAVTTRSLAPSGYAGTIVMHPIPLALIALPFAPAYGSVLLGLGIAARLWLKHRIDRLCGARTFSPWMLPARDILSFVVFLMSFFARSVDWRGARLRMERDRRTVRPHGV